MKGIILAGGKGTRLYPITKVYSKQLALIYDKPIIYYPLSILMLGNIKDILIISDVETLEMYKKLLGDGSQYGIKLSYAKQDAPKGIAEAFIIGKEFIGKDNVTLILGDNIFYGNLSFFYKALKIKKGGVIFGYQVNEPEKYGIIEFDEEGKPLKIIEKPKKAKSNFAVPGLYIYDNNVINIAENLKPSKRGELEITDVNNVYLKTGQLNVIKMGRGLAWLDTGDPKALLQASNFFGVIEERQGLKVACIEEIALTMKFISKEEFKHLMKQIPASYYKNYLQKVLEQVK